MSSPCPTRRLALGALAAAAVAGCGPKTPQLRQPAYEPGQQTGPGPTAISDLRPGNAPEPPPDPRAAYYEGNKDAIFAGQRWFQWYNCNGCHFNGGGGIGPALMDNKWRYGGRVDQIYRSIADGRPNGMPTWRGKIPDSQIWQLAAYVKWLSTPEAWQAMALPKTPLDPAGDVGYRQEPRFVSQ
jgi:cytochrome c oxidase cbb3-type subunit 3